MKILKMIKYGNDISDTKFLKYIFYAALFIWTVIALCYCAVTFSPDPSEFIHSSWLVSIGKMPYVDFFQHHNPLLWYLYAPVARLFERSVYIIYATNILSVLSYLLLFYFVYQITRKSLSYHIVASRISVISCVFMIPLFRSAEFRIDTMMLICQLYSLILLFKYLQHKKINTLIFSYILQAVAFLIIQKAVILGFAFAVSQIYLMVKKELSIKHFIMACVVPLLIVAAFICWLYFNNALELWYKLCIRFNSDMRFYYGHFSEIPLTNIVLLILFSFLICRFYKPSLNGNIILFHFICALLSVFYFAPHVWYTFPSYIFSAILAAPIFEKFFKKHGSVMIVVLLFCLFVFFCEGMKTFYFYQKNARHIQTVDYLIKNTSPDEPLMNGFLAHYYNLFNPDAHYVWFGYHNIAILYDLAYADQVFDYNTVMKQTKPKFLYHTDTMQELNVIAAYNTSWIVYYQNLMTKRLISHPELKDWFLKKWQSYNLKYWNIDEAWIQENYHKVNNPDLIGDLWERND